MELFKLVGQFVIDTNGMETQIDSIVSSVNGASTTFSQAGQQAETTGQQMGKAFGKNSSFGAGSVWLGNMLTSLSRKTLSFGKSLISSGIDYNSQMEQLTIGFSTMMGGNTEAAEGLVSEFQQLAKVTPMDTLGLAKTANLLMGYGTAAEDVVDTLTMLGDVAGGNQDKLDHLALAYGQAMAAGKLNAQDANQMISAGVPIWSMIADYMGLTVGEVKELSTEGAITSDILADVFKVATSEGGKYYKAMENQSKSYGGQLSTMKDLADQAKGAVMQPFFEIVSSTVFPKLIALLEKFTAWCTDNKEVLSEMAQGLWDSVRNITLFLKDLFTLILDNKELVVGAIGAIATAFLLFKLTTNPIGGIVKIIIALLGLLAANWETLKPIFENVITAVKDFFTVTVPEWWENSIITPIKNAWQSVVDIVNNAIDAVKNFFGIGEEADKRREEYVAGIEENKPVAEQYAGKYAVWTDAQKDAAYDYLYAYDGGFSTAPEIEAMKAAGLSQTAVDEFRADVATALAEGDYSITIEDTWFDETAETELQGQLDEMGLEATVALVPEYSQVSGLFTNGAMAVPNADGSHASGLDRVPFDGYRAILHKDEAVLNATNASVWRNGGGMGNTSRLEGMMQQLLGVMNQVVANTGRNQTVVLDSGVLVGQIAPKMDIQLGTFASKKGRGIG